MIQLNLLPDIKLEYIRAARLKRMVIGLSAIVSIAAIAITVFLAVLTFSARGTHLSNLNNDVSAGIDELQETQDIDKILTVQNQLSVLNVLHAEKPEASRLFNFFSTLTPEDVFISEISVSIIDSRIQVSGTATDIAKINQYADTFKFAEFVVVNDDSTEEPVPQKAFSGVVLSSFGLGEESTSYSITFQFDEALLDYEQNIRLSVPDGLVTTRSQIEKPRFVEINQEDQ